MSTKRERAVRAMIDKEGLELVSLTLRGSGHLGAVVRRPSDGAEQTFIFSFSPSDVRGDMNKRAMLRRWARGVSHTVCGQARPSFITGAASA